MNDYLENADPRTLALGLGAIVLLACLIQVIYLLWPQLQRYNELAASHSVLLGAANSEAGLLQELQSSSSRVEGLERNLHGDMAGLPVEQMESYIIGRLQKVSWETNVELISVKPGIGQQVQMYQESLFDIQIHARYHDFFSWLNTIGHELGFIVVKRYRIHPQGKELTDPVLDITLTMVSYRIVRP